MLRRFSKRLRLETPRQVFRVALKKSGVDKRYIVKGKIKTPLNVLDSSLIQFDKAYVSNVHKIGELKVLFNLTQKIGRF